MFSIQYSTKMKHNSEKNARPEFHVELVHPQLKFPSTSHTCIDIGIIGWMR